MQLLLARNRRGAFFIGKLNIGGVRVSTDSSNMLLQSSVYFLFTTNSHRIFINIIRCYCRYNWNSDFNGLWLECIEDECNIIDRLILLSSMWKPYIRVIHSFIRSTSAHFIWNGWNIVVGRSGVICFAWYENPSTTSTFAEIPIFGIIA